MSDAFAAALSALHADPNLSSAATWSRGGSSADLRVILSAPNIIQAVATAGVVDADAMAMVPVSALAQAPRAGDGLAVGTTAYTIVSVERDAERITWSLGLRRGAATTTAGTALANAVPA